ncbi:MAG: polyprenyl synthetase family protein [Ignavibacteria bacterium]
MNITDGNRFKKIYDSQRIKLEVRISELFKDKEPVSLYEPCSFIIQSGGKRLRPLLVLIAARAVGGRFRDAQDAAVAVELLHNFTLVHDDIMDNAEKRRGRPTLHKKYDLNAAILAGDNLLGAAYEFLLKGCHEKDKNILATFTRGLIEVCEGQSLDKEFETRDSVLIDEYLVMIQKKTAALFETCCSIGAQIGNGSKAEVKALTGFGRSLGMAFQLQDDLLDIMAEEAELGKMIGGDLIEGKKTFLFLKALQLAEKPEDKKALQNVIDNKGIQKEEIDAYRDIYRRLNVIEETEKEINRYTLLALKEINKLKNAEFKAMLEWLANWLLGRNK